MGLPMQFMTREVFDTLIIVIIIIGGAFAVVRLYKDLTRPLPEEWNDWHNEPPPVNDEDDTRPNRPVNPMDT
jgi:hypothetical protein